jgi:cytochrome c peroxidase
MEPIGTTTHKPFVYGERPSVEQLVNLGKRMFYDPSLSASGKLSCASCHDPKHAFGSPNASMVQPGGPNLDRTGYRNTPSLRYGHSVIAFTEHFYESEVTFGVDDQGPTGGRTWDGRVDAAHDQALMPLMDANEMANANVDELVKRLRSSAYSDDFRKAVSPPNEDVFDNPKSAAAWLGVAIEAYETRLPEFHPFDSKFDAYLKDEVDLSPAERRGMALFNDMQKGNCFSCHTSTRENSNSRPPIFTDFGYVALAVPRNRALPANRDPNFYDLGLGGPLRTDMKTKVEHYGEFRTPTLRNVALKKSFFHNGAIHTLREAVDFYVTRDTNPEKWYPRDSEGKATYDDLPKKYWGNVSQEVPFKPYPNGKPRLSPAEIDDIVAFLQTLTDGFVPPRKP